MAHYLLAIGHCHGTTNYNPATPECYHPGPGILPVWESDLLAWVVALIFFSIVFYAYWRICHPRR